MLALEAPLLKLTLAAGALATIAALAPARHHHGKHHGSMHKLVLHAEHNPNYTYLSAWELNNFDVWADVDVHHLTPMQYEIQGEVYGCLWQGTETLMPNGNHYDYTYTDEIVSCGPHPVPAEPTPRAGIVTIE